jgi:hypothetical protein
MTSTTTPLSDLAALLRDADNVISPYVIESDQDAVLGALAAAGPRAADAPGEYVFLVEAIREGYLLHYETPRLIVGADSDLRLLAGDYLYALGLERLAARGDLTAVGELADLISLSAQVHAADGAGPGGDAIKALWLAEAVAVATGPGDQLESAKRALRGGDPDATRLLALFAAESARLAGLGDALARAAEAIGFAAEDVSNRG